MHSFNNNDTLKFHGPKKEWINIQNNSMSCRSQTRETENSKLEYYVEFDRKLHHYFLIVYTEIECHIDKKKSMKGENYK